MALLIEALFSPVWLNSNGLRFDFPRNKAGEPKQHTQTHTAAGYLGQEEQAVRRKRTNPSANVKTQGDGQRDNMDDRMVNVSTQLNMDMSSKLESGFMRQY